MQIRGAIFDWDGVVIDSSRHHEESWERLAREEGLPLPEGHFKRGFGMKNEVIIPEQLHWATDRGEIQRLSLRKEALYREVVRAWGIDPLPGVSALLTSLADAGIPAVIGSSTHRENIETALGLLGFRDRFAAMVTAEDVHRGKPDPEVFLKAAGRIERAPAECVVFEDALVGIEAAKAAGMRVIAVATTHPLQELSHADLAVATLEAVSADRLTAW